ncbi:MAG: YbhB/YbcL family Raf kinase inhibitor-like protein [Candidatus Dactylopiibacterium sp.]|nr:YbhB/YbcL family Raf kinase inhibitor-like protein [Candidatus Dactylopiibacterium sp.]
MSDFRLSSRDFQEGQTLTQAQVFDAIGGGNLSPHLAWEGAPAGTRSFAVTCFDPDAPTGSGWWHWTLVNLPAATRELPAGASRSGALPAGAVQGRTDYGQSCFGGACPPEGDAPHRYVFTVWALGVETLALDAGSSGAMVGFNLNANVLARASLTARFGR